VIEKFQKMKKMELEKVDEKVGLNNLRKYAKSFLGSS